MISFKQLAVSGTTNGIYEGSKSNPSSGLPWFGLVLLNQEQSADPVSFSKAWSLSNAHYIITKADPSNPATFLDRVNTYVTAQGKGFRFFLWIDNPDTWDGIASPKSFIGFGTNSSKEQQVLKPSAIGFRMISLNIPGSSSSAAGVLLGIDATDGNNSFVLNNPVGCQPFQGNPSKCMGLLVSPQSPKYIMGVNQKVNFAVEGPNAFLFQFPFTMMLSPASENDFNILQVGLKYFYPGPAPDNFLQSQYYPVLGYPVNPQQQFLLFNASLDPFAPQNVDRTYFLFQPKYADKTGVVLKSSYMTDYGHNIQLAPDGITAKLVLQGDKTMVVSGTKQTQADSYYLAPHGDFFMSLPAGDTSKNPKVMCGLSGTEVVQFTQAFATVNGDFMCFEAGNAAYAKTFVRGQTAAVPDLKDMTSLLQKDYTSSWVCVAPSSRDTLPTQYFVQPPSAPLFAPGFGVNPKAPGFLGFFEAPAKSFTLDTIHYFPMVPYLNTVAGNGPDLFTAADIKEFEIQVLVPVRKGELSSNVSLTPVNKPGTLPISSTTPQGLLADVDAVSGNYNKVTLAMNQVKDDAGNIRDYALTLSNIDPQLRDALQSNRLMLVATSNEHIGVPPTDKPLPGKPMFANEMSIAGWPFLLNVGKNNTYGNYTNVMLFKFCPGKLKDLVTDTGRWTQPTDFNNPDEVDVVSQWLSQYIQNAEQMLANGNTYYKNFCNIVNLDNWSGILVLRTDISLVSFPQQMQGLLAGIDLSQFYGHHFGIQVNHVTPDKDGKLQMAKQSSLFGLIDYQNSVYRAQQQAGNDPNQPVPPAAGDFDFKVLLLDVLFQNSAVQDFSSKVQVTTNKFFDDNVKLKNDYDNNSIVLNGSYQNHNGNACYVFDETGDSMFDTGGNVLTNVEVVKVQFNTLQNQAGDASTAVHARFSFWGYLHFSQLANGMDMFSFGGKGNGLYYSNLYLDLDFDVTTPSARKFSFDPLQIAFDPQQSLPRSNSLYQSFPLQLKRLISGSDKNTPTNAGYLTVGVTFPGALDKNWYGIVYNIDMGTPGNLVSDLGFSSSMLMAWSPRSKGNSYKALLGLQLPGTAGVGKLMSIQGVMKLAIETLKMDYVKVEPGTGNASSAYMLTMGNMALKFLGIVKLPPDANISCYIFGNPQNQTRSGSLAWYAAYVQNTSAKEAMPENLIPLST